MKYTRINRVKVFIFFLRVVFFQFFFHRAISSNRLSVLTEKRFEVLGFISVNIDAQGAYEKFNNFIKCFAVQVKESGSLAVRLLREQRIVGSKLRGVQISLTATWV